ncbi:MAG TPA: primosomal protein N' [Firmicutes bacterium]|nr:primosomal protein N' [Bacillota bacterium]
MNPGRYVQACVNLPELPDDRLYDYHIPADWPFIPSPGSRVLVPFAGRRAEAIVWGCQEPTYPETIKDVLAVLDDTPLLTPDQMSLIDWLAMRYFCRRQDLLHLFLPPGLKARTEKCWRLTGEPAKMTALLDRLPLPPEVLQDLRKALAGLAEEYTPLPKLPTEFKPYLNQFVEQGFIKICWRPQKPAVNFKTVQAYTLAPEFSRAAADRLTAKQQKVVAFLADQTTPVSTKEILAATGVTASVLTALCQRGYLTKTTLTLERNPFRQPAVPQPVPELNAEQAQALAQIRAALHRGETAAFLLHGVTGSGKTEVYLQAIAEALKLGKDAIFLVPEIALTPQTVERVRARFGETVAVMHSSLSEGERFEQWWKMKNGEVKVVVGARSAVFAPLPNLGLIIVDEEHEFTYKQEEVPRYHAKEVAYELCRRNKGVLVLGSATPSLESVYAREKGELIGLTLTQRVFGRPLPRVQVVDLRQEFKARRFTVLSPVLKDEIAKRLQRREQVIILLNRRGFATFILCRECGQVLKCSACDVTLTYHRKPNVLRCHYCDYQMVPPDRCPHCQSHYIRYFGHGTQRLEEELTTEFPHARVARMDLDTTSRKGSHEQIYRQLVRREIDILLGTQMVAKGLDLPNVTLVGIVAADAGLNLPDFRAAERTYQLLTQAAGRAGRGSEAGLVVVQTYNPEHYSIKALVAQEEAAFYRQELAYREAANYPPFTHLIRVLFSGPDQHAVVKAAQKWTSLLQMALAKLALPPATMEIIGPQPALIEKIKNKFRWHTLLKTKELVLAERLLPRVVQALNRERRQGVRIIIDENPYSVL